MTVLTSGDSDPLCILQRHQAAAGRPGSGGCRSSTSLSLLSSSYLAVQLVPVCSTWLCLYNLSLSYKVNLFLAVKLCSVSSPYSVHLTCPFKSNWLFGKEWSSGLCIFYKCALCSAQGVQYVLYRVIPYYLIPYYTFSITKHYNIEI